MPNVAITIRPLDLLFFRGGRPFAAGLPGVSALPTPQALIGLIRTVLLQGNGVDFARLRGIPKVRDAFSAVGCAWLADVSVRGPFLFHDKLGPIFRAPASVVFGRERQPRLMSPLNVAVPGWAGAFPDARPLQLMERPDRAKPEFITGQGLQRFLSGKPPESRSLLTSSCLFAFDERTGIGINPDTLSTLQGVIYSTRKLALCPEVSFYAEVVDIPKEQTRHFAQPFVAAWGGERHHVSIHPAERMEWPSGPPAEDGRVLLYLASPCFELADGVPAGISCASVRAAVTVGPVALSGWDLVKGGPKPTRFGLDGGSVFFLENTAIPDTLASPSDALAGYGLTMRGSWNYAN